MNILDIVRRESLHGDPTFDGPFTWSSGSTPTITVEAASGYYKAVARVNMLVSGDFTLPSGSSIKFPLTNGLSGSPKKHLEIASLGDAFVSANKAIATLSSGGGSHYHLSFLLRKEEGSLSYLVRNSLGEKFEVTYEDDSGTNETGAMVGELKFVLLGAQDAETRY